MRCQKARLDGARFERGLNRDVRPCEPDDIYRVVKALFRSGRIRSVNLGVLHRFGVLDRPPDPRCNEELLAARHWQEALIQLTSILRDKGIVA